MTSIVELFTDEKIVSRIKNKLPKLFHIADLESQRAGKIGMEVGSIRERIIVSLLIYKFIFFRDTRCNLFPSKRYRHQPDAGNQYRQVIIVIHLFQIFVQ